MDLKNNETDYEHQNFENLSVNPYEIVIAVSRKAREINAKALKYLGPEAEIKPIGMILNKLNDKNVTFEYPEKSRESTEVQSETKIIDKKNKDLPSESPAKDVDEPK